jgi:RNA recognition motif-containing protein
MLGTTEKKNRRNRRMEIFKRASFCLVAAMWLSRFTVRAFTFQSSSSLRVSILLPPITQLNVHMHRESDFTEELIGGKRYETTHLPDSMVETTLFVGNLCEFVHDEDLSKLFQAVSILCSVPACVARKADTSSLQYGFVAFPTKEEKEVGT